MRSFDEIMQARCESFAAVRGRLSPMGQAFVDRILDPSGFAVTAQRVYRETRSAGGSEDDAYAAVYAIVPPMWADAGYHELPLSDLLALSRAEAGATSLREALLHSSARHMYPVALRVLSETIRRRLRR